MRLKITLDDIPAKIIAETCGTAAQKTITVKVNSEMTIESAKRLIREIDHAGSWLRYAKKNCEACDHYGDCIEREPTNG